jgi:hypothetical protein
MNSDRDRTFTPRLESLDDRFLLTGFVIYRYLVPPNLSRLPAFPPRPAVVGGNHTPAQIRTIVNPIGAATRSVSIVPQHISLGLSDLPSKINVPGFDAGIGNSGLRTPSVIASDAGINTPGLIPFTLVPATATSSSQSPGLTLSPQGVVSGSLF